LTTTLRRIGPEDIRAMIAKHTGVDPGPLDPARIRPLRESDRLVLERMGIPRPRPWVSDVPILVRRGKPVPQLERQLTYPCIPVIPHPRGEK